NLLLVVMLAFFLIRKTETYQMYNQYLIQPQALHSILPKRVNINLVYYRQQDWRRLDKNDVYHLHHLLNNTWYPLSPDHMAKNLPSIHSYKLLLLLSNYYLRFLNLFVLYEIYLEYRSSTILSVDLYLGA